MNLPEKIRALFTSYKGIFQGALTQAKSDWTAYATQVASSSATSTYGWLGQSTQFRKWVGDRLAQTVAKLGYVIKNETWEMTQAIPKEAVEDDEVGIFTPLIQDMGDSAAAHPGELVFNALYAGDTNLCYDGKAYFSTNHPLAINEDGTPVDGGATFSNLLLANGVTEDAVPADAPKWVLCANGRAIKPVIYQLRKAPVFVSKTALDDETVFRTNTFEFGADKRDAVGYTLPQFAVMARVPLTRANFAKAYKMLEKMTGDKGKALGVVPTHLLVDPELREAAEDVLLTEKTDGGKSNTYFKRVELTVTNHFGTL